MHISILTLFPKMFSGPFSSSIIKRAVDSHHVDIRIINLRDFSDDKYKSVDDHPYGGGIGMVLRVDVVDRALKSITSQVTSSKKERIILLDPQGKPYKQAKAVSLSRYDHLILLCAHYEGIDQRVRALVDEELSIGDYVLTGGEIPAMVVVDSVVRLLPGVLKKEATGDESFSDGLLEYPQYTRPQTYGNTSVPSILLSGNHAKITQWRKNQSLIRTKKRRPDLL